MKTHRSRVWRKLAAALAITILTLAANPIRMVAQEETQTPAAVVPTVVQFSGVLRDENGKPISGTVGVTFLLYKEQQGGAPLWLETQNVQPDKTGRYSVMLGSTRSYGLPSDIFVAGEARWLAVQAQGQAEQPRVMLLSVPYALKAGDAETLGGLPASAFALASSLNAGGATLGATNASTSLPSTTSAPSTTSNVTTTGGTVSAVPLWTTATNIQTSALTQTGTGSAAKIGVNTSTPAATLDVKGSANVEGLLTMPATGTATASAGKNSQPQAFVASVFNGSTSTVVPQKFQWQAEAVGNNTTAASGTLNLLYAPGTGIPAETGLKISSKGLFTFASGQSFPGTGTITSVNPGTDLLGGGNTGRVTLSVDTSKVVTGVTAGLGLAGGGTGGVPTLSVDSTQVPFLNASANTFFGNQNINGSVSILNNATFQPLSVQSSSTFGTWLNLINTSTGGHQWSILSAGGANGEGAGNLGITNFTGNSNIFLEGNVKATTLSVNNDTPMSSNPHMVFSGFLAGNLGNSPFGGFFIPDKNITVTRITASEGTNGSGCSSDSVAMVEDQNTLTTIFSLDLGQDLFVADSGPVSLPVSAGAKIEIFGTAASGCSLFGSSPSNVFVNVQYVMQ